MTYAVLAALLFPTFVFAQTRKVEQIVSSDSLPRIIAKVDPSLAYLGTFRSMAMNDRAEAERHVFGDVQGGKLKRVAIVHFERVMPGADLAFGYPRFRMKTLDNVEYLEQIWPIEKSTIFDPPGFQAILKKWGASAEPNWLMHRYVRAVDPAMKNEVILFYMEAESTVGVSMTELAKDWQQQGIAGPTHKSLEDAFRARADAALSVVHPGG